jgi:murein DD-endopeptidase MepM/ murein hydrolase activator NlpD
LRARGFWPTDLDRYHIFGEAVYAPCDGEVIRAEDRLPDLPPPSSDRERPAGNFVYLGCGETAILLAHLMQGSLAVAAGERVETGQFLARVGNSGYSTEPHLHLHAQQRVSAESFMAGEPVPLRIESRVPVRGDRLTLGGSSPARITPAHLP